jgi:hypothetical protein
MQYVAQFIVYQMKSRNRKGFIAALLHTQLFSYHSKVFRNYWGGWHFLSPYISCLHRITVLQKRVIRILNKSKFEPHTRSIYLRNLAYWNWMIFVCYNLVSLCLVLHIIFRQKDLEICFPNVVNFIRSTEAILRITIYAFV